MNIDQATIWIIIGAIAIAYCAIRFVLLPWMVPRLLDLSGRKLRGGGYDKARAKGAPRNEAFAEGKEVQREFDARVLAKESGVPLEIIRAFGRDHPNMYLTAEELPADAHGARFRVHGAEGGGSEDSPGHFAEKIYRLDGTLIADEDTDAGDAEPLVTTVSWEALPEHIRTAASAAVPDGEFVDACAPDDTDPYYEICLRTSFEHWVVEIDPNGKVLRTNKRRATGVILQS